MRWTAFSHGRWLSPFPAPAYANPLTSSTATCSHYQNHPSPQRAVLFWRLSHLPTPPRPSILPSNLITGAYRQPSHVQPPPPSEVGSFRSSSNPTIFHHTSFTPNQQPTPPALSPLASFSVTPRPPRSPLPTTAMSPFASPQQSGPLLPFGVQRHHSSVPGSTTSSDTTYPQFTCLTSPPPKPFLSPWSPSRADSHGTPSDVVAPPPSCTQAAPSTNSSPGAAGAAQPPYSPTLSKCSQSPSPPPPSSASSLRTSNQHLSPLLSYGRASYSRKVHVMPIHKVLFPLTTLPLQLPQIFPRQLNLALKVISSCLDEVPAHVASALGQALRRAPPTGSLEPPDSDSPPGGRPHREPTPESLQRGLGPRGYVNVPDVVWLKLNLPPSLPTLQYTHAPYSRHTTQTVAFLRTLAKHSFCFETYPQPGSLVFTTYKSGTQARLIADMRTYNLLWPRPLHLIYQVQPLCSLTPTFLPCSTLNWTLKTPSGL